MTKCKHYTKLGKRCKRDAVTRGFCSQHSKSSGSDDDSKYTVFVFYENGYTKRGKPKKFSLPRPPAKWTWTGSGGTPSRLYPHEAQYNGSTLAGRKTLAARMKKRFEELKSRGVVTRYKIRFTFKP
jgi:hypothetical protein